MQTSHRYLAGLLFLALGVFFLSWLFITSLPSSSPPTSQQPLPPLEGRGFPSPKRSNETMRANVLSYIRLKELGFYLGGYVIVSSRYKFIACVTPKVSCSTWLDYLRWVHLGDEACQKYTTFLPTKCTGETPTEGREETYSRRSHPEHGFFFWDSLTTEEKLMYAQDESYLKFVITRHPWSRLISGFGSKFTGDCEGNATCFARMWNNYRILETIQRTINNTNYSPFDAFVDAIVDSSPLHLNEHFQPQSSMCFHDVIPYQRYIDYAATSTFDELTQNLGLPASFSAATQQIVDLRFSESPQRREKVSYQPATLVKAYHFFREDYERFGYSLTEIRK